MPRKQLMPLNSEMKKAKPFPFNPIKTYKE